jgi:hypothetical protein
VADPARYRRIALVVTVALLIGLSEARSGHGEVGLVTRLIATMKELKSAQVAFAVTCGGGSYAVSLDQLKTPRLFDVDQPGASAEMAVLLGPGLLAAPGPNDCLGRPTALAYYAAATYKVKEWKGPSFAMRADGLVRQSETANPPREPFDEALAIVR